MKAVVKYPGSKWSIAEWIVREMEEPLVGTGGISGRG